MSEDRPQATNGATGEAKARPSGENGIAIIGMACMFPGSPNLDAYWRNIIGKVDCITDPPPEAWDSDVYYDPDSSANDRVYCKKGGYLGPLAYFDPLENGIPPVAVGGEPDQWLALKLAREALADAGYPDGPGDGKNTAVVLGKGTYLNAGNLSMVQHGLVLDQTVRILKSLHPEYTDDELATIREELKKGLPPVTAETVPGLIPNIIAGRIANRMDLMGPSFTVDGACASSLLAVDIALRDLLSGRLDMAIVGGSQISTPVPIAGVFCQLNALSHREQIRPFDKDADGTILGEGIGVLILKRLEEAERDGDRVYAVIKGIGTSSDGRGLSVMAPRVEGEELALRRAYEMAGVPPRTVGLIEAHGTATPAGDVAEIESLTRVFGPRDPEKDGLPWCAIGTVKSMIGHTMPASGAAGLIKTALALYHKVLPPTLNCDEPNPKLGLEKTPFYVNTETRPWVHGDPETPRRAGVNAFGFGGINAHVVLEEYPDPKEAASPGHQPQWDSEALVLSAASREALVERARQVERFIAAQPETDLKDLAYTLNSEMDGGSYRLALVAASIGDLRDKLERAAQRLSEPDCKQIKDRAGVYFFEEPIARKGKLAFLFPGEGAQYQNMLADLCLHFPEVRACFDQLDRIFSNHSRRLKPSDFIFPRPAFSDEEREAIERQLWEADGAIEAVLTANHAVYALLSRLQVRPDAIVGHSTGEYSAMRAAGILDLDDEVKLARFALDMNLIYERESAGNGIPKAALVAVGADRAQVSEIVAKVGGNVFVAMDNCPHQAVMVGAPDAAERAAEEARQLGLICESLSFDRAYHTPLFAPYAQGMRRFFESLPMSAPGVETWSCTTASPYPADVDAIRELAVEHWVCPVEFRKTIEAMYEAGVRVFVEAGPRGNLTAFVDDILRGKPYLAVPANVQRRSGVTQLNHLVAILAAQGVPMSLDYLYARRSPQRLTLDAEAAPARKKSAAVKLHTGWPPMNVSEEVARTVRSRLEARSPTAARQPSESKPEPTELADTPVSPAAPQSTPAPSPQSQGAPIIDSQPMQAYFRTMEQFLEAQEQVMQAFLRASQGAPAAAWTAPQVSAPTPTVQPAQDAPAPPPSPEPAQDAPAHTPAEQPQPDVEPAIAEAPAGHSREAVQQRLLALVSDRTGYPDDVLDLDMDVEADLGIDSIKRVEILGAFAAEHGISQDDRMESIGELKTLRQMIDFLAGLLAAEAPVAGRPEAPAGKPAGAAPAPSGGFPFIGTVISHVPGRELIVRREVRWDEDLYLHDHTLGREVSASDPDLRPLPVMPLTMSMEALAEAGAVLMQDRLLVGMKDLHAHRWIKLEDESVHLEIVARLKPGSDSEVDVRIVELQEPEGGEPTPTDTLVEATLVFADAYPEPDAAQDLALTGGRPSRWTPDRLYSEAMFHGPRWQGVESIDRWGENGTAATLRVLPWNDYFHADPNPRFVTDPTVLDAAGQLVGFWTQERLESGFVVFPYRLKELRIYGPNQPAGARLRCQAQISLVGDKQVSSDIDVVLPDGRLWMRLLGWEDKQFDLPQDLYRYLLSPGRSALSSPWAVPVSDFNGSGKFQCYRILDPFDSDKAFWMSVFAPLTLGRAERDSFRSLRGPRVRRTDWLMGRIAAKDAVRALVKDAYGLDLLPADIEIVRDEDGQPILQGAWTANVESVPAVSLAHKNGLAVAVAGIVEGDQRLGVDIEPVKAQPPGFEEQAFLPEERAILDSLPADSRDEWAMRLWCAKEAIGKSLGRGLIEGPRGVAAQRIDPETGTVWAVLRGKLAEEFPDLSGNAILAYTAREGDYAVASTLCEKEQP